MGKRAKEPTEIPLVLPLEGCWELEEATVDSVQFFQSLAPMFPEATAAFVEGVSIAPDAAALFRCFPYGGKYLPKSQTIWPAPERFSCAFSAKFCLELAAIADNHAEPELFDHFFLYAGTAPLLEWPDAFHNCMWIVSSISEARVARFANGFGLRYRHERVG